MAMTCSTYTSYVKAGCRCTDCRRANTEQQKAYQARKRSPNTMRGGMAASNIHRIFPLLTPLDLVDHGACRGHHATMFLGDAARTDRLPRTCGSSPTTVTARWRSGVPGLRPEILPRGSCAAPA